MDSPTQAADHMAESSHGLEGRIEGDTTNGVIDAVETAPTGQTQYIVRDAFGPVNEGRAQAFDDGAAMRRSGSENFRAESACELDRDMADAAGHAVDRIAGAQIGHSVTHRFDGAGKAAIRNGVPYVSRIAAFIVLVMVVSPVSWSLLLRIP